MKILVVEDDPTIGRSLQFLLSRYHYVVDLAADGEVGREMVAAFDYDLVLLDLMLPRLDGVSLCRELRSQGFQRPILLLTGQDDSQQKAIALNAGADDYVVKPFDAEELMARVQALLRRGNVTQSPILTWGLLAIDPNRCKATYGSTLLSLSPKEYALLELFLRSPLTAFNARALLEHAWTSIEFPGEDAVRVHIKGLRQKLVAAGAAKDFIQTQHGFGYQLNPCYSNVLATQVEQQPTPSQVAELARMNEALRVTLEELQVTQEELREQNEQLQATQQTLDLERQRYRDLFEFAPDAYLVTNLQGVIQEANAAAQELLNCETSQLIGKPLIVFLALRDRPDFRKRLGQLTFGEDWELTLQPHHASAISVLVAVKDILDLQNKVVGLRWSLHDIRFRKAKEEQLQVSHQHLEHTLQENEERLRLALELNAIGMWEWQVETGMVTWNADHYRLLGYQPEVTTPSFDHWRDRVYPEDLTAVEDRISQALTTRRDYVAEYRVLLPDGRLCWLMDKGRALYNELGQPLRMIGVSFDISDRKQAEIKQQQVRRNLALLAEVSQDLADWESLDTTIKIVSAKIGAFLKVDRCYYAEVDSPRGIAFIYQDWHQADLPSLARPEPYQLTDFVTDEFYQSLSAGEMMIVCDTHTDSRTDGPACDALRVRSLIASPLIQDGQWRFLLNITTREPRDWRDDEIDLVRELTTRIWIRLERAHAEAALRQSEAKYRSLFESIDEGFCLIEMLLDPDGQAVDYRLLEINPAFERQTGLVNAVGKTVHELVPNNEGYWLEIYGAVAQTGVAQRFENYVQDLGRFYDVYAFRVGQPEEHRVAILFNDITESKQTEAALRQSEEKYRTLFNSIEESYFLAEVIFDDQDRPVDILYLEANPAAIAITGQDFTGRRLRDINPNYEEYWYEIFGRVALTGRGERFEQYSGPDRTWCDCYVFKIGGQDSRRVAIVFQNITARKHRETSTAFVMDMTEAIAPLTLAEDIIQAVGKKLGAHLQVTHCNFCEINEAQDEVIYLGNWNDPSHPPLSNRLRLSEQLSEEFCRRAHAGETIVSHNPQANPITQREANAAIGSVAFIAIPFHKEGQWKYLFSISDHRPRTWHQDEIELMQDLANRIFPRLERAQAEATLRQNEQLLRLILAGVKAGSWDWNLVTDHLFWSPEMFSLYGLTPADSPPAYKYWQTQILHPDDRAWVSDCLARVIAQRQRALHLEFRILHPQRGVRWVLSLSHLTINDQGQPIRLSGINLDVSDRKQAEQKILEQAALLDIASDAIFVRDLDHRILYWNQGAERLYGWRAEEAIGQVAYQLLGHDQTQVAEIMPVLLRQGEWQGEMHKFTQGGQELIIATRWTLARDEAGHPRFILSVDTDITEKKQLETQFYRAQRLESLGTLASGIAHDLNNVLTPILTIAQLFRLNPQNLNDQEQGMLQMIEESAQRGASLIRQILTFTRGTRGECIPVAVAPILQEVVHVAQQTFPKGITIYSLIPDEPLWLVSADSTYLHQVVMNLCVNARDAMPKGGTLTLSIANIEVDEAFVETHLDAKVGNFVVITVADTGCGIPPEVRDRIFEPFFTTKLTGQGTGLGLSTVLGIVKNYGGFLQVLSEPDAGTWIKVYLPALEVATIADSPEADSYTGNWELVLVVDDDVAVQQTTRALLDSNFYMTLVASNAASAIELYSQHQADIALVILDIMMPEMNGIELTERLKAINPACKIIAMSGLLTHQDAAIAAGANIFLPKPYVSETFLKHVWTLTRD